MSTHVMTAQVGWRPSAAAPPPNFEDEMMPHLRSLYTVAVRLTRNAHDAEDLVQEACLRAYRSRRLYQPGTDIRAWLFTILYRAQTDTLRRASRRLRTVSLADENAPEPPAPSAPSGDVAEALERLPDVYRAAVVLRDVEGFGYDEIAAILQVPVGTVMSRIYRGRTHLRAALRGFPADENPGRLERVEGS